MNRWQTRLASTHTPRFFQLALIFTLLSIILLPVSAQPRTLQSGIGVTGAVSAEAPLSLFIFSGIEGEIVSISAMSLTSGFTPTFTILDSAQRPLASGDGLSATVILPADGSYTLLVGGQNNQAGEFVIRVDGGATGQVFPMIPDEQLRVDVAPTGSAQVLSFTSAGSDYLLRLGTPEIGGGNATPFDARIVTATSGLIADYHGIPGAYLLIPAGSGQVYVILNAASRAGGVDIILQSSGASTSGTPATSTGQQTAPTSTDGACTLTAGASGVNVRAGDGTNFAVIAQLTGSSAVIGRNAANTWFAVNTSSGTGWVAGQVVTLGGNCNNLQVLAVTAAPQQPTAAPAQVNPTTPPQGDNGQTTQPTNAPAPTQAPDTPTAPADNATHRFDVNRNSGGSFSEVISYPNGDTTDRIEMVVNLDSVTTSRNITITLNCNGTGTQNVTLSLNNNTVGCGQSITARYNREQPRGYYTVAINSGGPSYVNYTLVATVAD